jgi:hypothetical protein
LRFRAVRSGGNHAEEGGIPMCDRDQEIEERLETTKDWALEARVDSAALANEGAFRRGYGAGWAGQSNAEDDADYVTGYEFGRDDRKEANAESRIA